MRGGSLAWTIEYTREAIRELGKLDKQIAKRIIDFLDLRVATSDDPRLTGKALRGPMGDLWRYRVGNYRVLCEISDLSLVVLVVHAGHRSSIYG